MGKFFPRHPSIDRLIDDGIEILQVYERSLMQTAMKVRRGSKHQQKPQDREVEQNTQLVLGNQLSKPTGIVIYNWQTAGQIVKELVVKYRDRPERLQAPSDLHALTSVKYGQVVA